MTYWQKLKRGLFNSESQDVEVSESLAQTSMRPALFLHIQKTAGTSVQEMARSAYGNDQVISHGDFLELGHEGCRKYDFLSGHFGFEFARPHMEGRYCFTFLRDPIERLLSLYEFCKTRDPAEHAIYAVAQSTDLEGFLCESHGPGHVSMIWNNETWQLTHGWGHMMAGGPPVDLLRTDRQDLLASSKANLEKFDYVGFVQTFDADIRRIFSDLGAPHLTPVRTNTVRRKHQRASISPAARAQLEKMTELDRDLYEYALRTYANARVEGP